MRIVVAGLIAVVLASAAQPVSAGGRGVQALLAQGTQAKKLPCKFAQKDLVCRIRKVLNVSPRPGGRAPKVSQLQPASNVEVRRRGQASVLFSRDAQCYLLARGARTAILTRRPQDFLFTQRQGETLCTISGRKKVLLQGQAVPSRSAQTQGVKNYVAILQESGDRDDPIQYRVRLRPKSSVGIAMRSGGLSIVMSSGEERDIGQGQELLASLTRKNTIKPGTVRVEGAHFDPTEGAFFDKAERSWFPLTVDSAGGGQGIVVSNPVGIECGDDCEESYASGMTVSLTARPVDGAEFTGWRGDCEGTAKRCVVTMKGARSVTAVFTQPLRLTVSRAGSGTGTVTSAPGGIECGSSCQAEYGPGTVVSLTARPAAGSTFAGWSGSCAGAPNPCSVRMDDSKSVTATFVTGIVGSFGLHVDKEGSGSGTVTSFPGGINCGPSCDAQYSPGTNVELAANATPGSRFAGWSSGPCAPTANPCIFPINSPVAVTATFAQQFQLSVEKFGGGSGTVISYPTGISCGGTCAAAYDSGTEVELSASADGGSRFVAWGGACVGMESSCLVTMDQVRYVTATFVRRFQLSVTFTNPGSGYVTIDPGGINCATDCVVTYDEGTGVTLTAIPNGGWDLESWGGDCSGFGTCVLAMDADKSVNVTWTPTD